MSRFLLLCGLRWGPAGLIAPGDDDRGTHVCGLTSPHEGHRCFLCGAASTELTACPEIYDRTRRIIEPPGDIS